MADTRLRIQELAKQNHITLAEIASRLTNGDKIGIDRVSFQQALKRNQFAIPRLAEIADILGVEIPDLFEVNQPTSLKCPHCGKPISIHLQ